MFVVVMDVPSAGWFVQSIPDSVQDVSATVKVEIGVVPLVSRELPNICSFAELKEPVLLIPVRSNLRNARRSKPVFEPVICLTSKIVELPKLSPEKLPSRTYASGATAGITNSAIAALGK